MAKIKSALLFVLVLVSLILSVSLMVGQAIPGRPQEHEQVYFGPKPEISDVCLPGRVQIIQHDGTVRQVKTFSGYYTELIINLSQLQYGADEGEVWQPTEPPSPYAHGVLFRYDYPISKGLLATLLVNFHETDFPFEVESIDAIFISYELEAGSEEEGQDTEPQDPYQQHGLVFFINEQAQQAWKLTGGLAWEVFREAVNSPRDILGLKMGVMEPQLEYTIAPRVYDASDSFYIPLPAAYQEETDYNALVRAFYLDPSITRLIQERDGTELFTDGFQALRIYPSGALEYSVARSRPGTLIPEQVDMVDAALDFVTSHGGWPGDMLLNDTHVLPGGQVRLEFASLGRGLPLYGDNVGIIVDMEGLAISYYSRKLLFATDEDSGRHALARPLRELLNTPDTEASQAVLPLQGRISDVSLGYYWLEERVHVVWRVKVDEHVFLVCAEHGTILGRGGE